MMRFNRWLVAALHAALICAAGYASIAASMGVLRDREAEAERYLTPGLTELELCSDRLARGLDRHSPYQRAVNKYGRDLWADGELLAEAARDAEAAPMNLYLAYHYLSVRNDVYETALRLRELRLALPPER
jgi:hypothetical protein